MGGVLEAWGDIVVHMGYVGHWIWMALGCSWGCSGGYERLQWDMGVHWRMWSL